jgi:hypothetical protein
MESVIERVEQARHREQGTVAELPSPAPVQPLMNLIISAPDQTPQPPAASIPSAPSGPPLAINPMLTANQPNLSTARGGGGEAVPGEGGGVVDKGETAGGEQEGAGKLIGQ